MLNIHAEFHLPSNCQTLVIESDSLICIVQKHCTVVLRNQNYKKAVITVQMFEYNYRPTVLDVLI